MIAGGAATVVALLALAWTREMVRGFLGLFGVASDSNSVKVTAIVIAILFMYVLDFSINTGKVQYPSS
jgi:solute carrier family 45, member 1/2/4